MSFVYMEITGTLGTSRYICDWTTICAHYFWRFTQVHIMHSLGISQQGPRSFHLSWAPLWIKEHSFKFYVLDITSKSSHLNVIEDYWNVMHRTFERRNPRNLWIHTSSRTFCKIYDVHFSQNISRSSWIPRFRYSIVNLQTFSRLIVLQLNTLMSIN